MKFIKRLFLLIILFLLVGGIWAYKEGMRMDNYESFIAEYIERLKYNFEEASDEGDDEIVDIETPNEFTTPRKKEVELQPLPVNPFLKIDRHARNCPESMETDISTLANYLNQEAHNDLESARAIFIWLTENISYDDYGYNTADYGDYSAESVLSEKVAVCAGFSNLYQAMGLEMGLEIENVSGYAKGYGFNQGQSFNTTNHAWNLIKIDNEWKVFDATWGTGNGSEINGKLVSKKEFDDYWFNVDPYEAIFTHLPGKASQMHVSPAMNLRSFETLPYVHGSYFDIGFNGRQIFEIAHANKKVRFPDAFNVGTHIDVNSAPKFAYPQIGRNYEFSFYIPRALSVAIVDAENNWTYFEGDKGVFKLNYIPALEGSLMIVTQFDKGGETYLTFLMYNVVQSKSLG